MKKLLIILAVLALAVPAIAVISGSDHDFSGAGWNSGGEICAPCHTPHNANTSVTGAPLWDHDVSTAAITPYTSGTMQGTPVAPTGTSLLCLSCHDGTVALDSFAGDVGTTFITGNELVGTDLSGSHPISFDYTDALATADGSLNPPSTTSSGLTGTIKVDLLSGDSLECSSCHDVHNGANEASLLVKSNAASALCLTCHAK